MGITNHPVSVVVPLSKGAYANTTTFRLVDAASNQVPAQFEVLNRWCGSDGSLRHLLIHLQTSLPPFTGSGTGTSMYYLRDDGLGNAGTRTALEVTNLTGAIRITTGPLRFTVNTNSFNLLDELYLDLNTNGVFESDERVISPHLRNGGVFTPWGAGGPVQYDSDRQDLAVSIEECGPMRAVIRVEALTQFFSTNHMIHGWAVRIYAYAGLPYIKLDYQLQNSAKNVKYSWPLYFESLHLDLRLNLNGSPWVRIGKADNTVWQGDRGAGLYFAQLHHNRFRVYDKGTGLPLYDSGVLPNGIGPPGFLDVDDGTKGVMAAIRYCWQTWPNGLEVDSTNKLSIQLFPEWSCQWYTNRFAANGLYWLEDMQHVYKEVLLYFHPAGVSDDELVRLARTFEYHPVGTLPVTHYTTGIRRLPWIFTVLCHATMSTAGSITSRSHTSTL
ncbi:MAG: hypothetical protein ACUVWX_06485, partial [Kiritimatiellia bacterium]